MTAFFNGQVQVVLKRVIDSSKVDRILMAGETKSLSGMQKRAAGNRAHNRMVLQKLVAFSLLIVLVPLTTFYSVHSLFTPGAPGSQYADAWSGFTAVLSVNVVIGLYILSAWKEDDGKEEAPPVGRFAKAKKQ